MSPNEKWLREHVASEYGFHTGDANEARVLACADEIANYRVHYALVKENLEAERQENAALRAQVEALKAERDFARADYERLLARHREDCLGQKPRTMAAPVASEPTSSLSPERVAEVAGVAVCGISFPPGQFLVQMCTLPKGHAGEHVNNAKGL